MNVTLNILQIETHPGAHEEYLKKGAHCIRLRLLVGAPAFRYCYDTDWRRES